MSQEDFHPKVIQKVVFKDQPKEDDVFIVEKCTYDEESDILFIHSCVPLLKQFITEIRNEAQEHFTLAYFTEFEQLLSSLIFFLTESENKDPFTCEGIPYRSR